MDHVVTGNLDIVDKLGNFDQLKRVIQLGYKYRIQSSNVTWGRIKRDLMETVESLKNRIIDKDNGNFNDFADVFHSKQSNDCLTMPQSCFPEAELTTFAFRSGEVKKLLLELDPYGGAGPDGIFPLFFIKTANYLAPKISTVLRKLVRIGGFSMCWRVGNITSLPKSGSANSCPSDYLPITITHVLSKLFERLLAKRLNNFAEKKNLFPNLQFGFRKGLGTVMPF